MKHFIELPARKLFEKLDGKTDGPLGPGGPIGRAIRSLNENLKPIVNFEHILSNLPADINQEEFNGRLDLLLLLIFVRAVETGYLDMKYVYKILPAISTVRWMTTWIRVLRLYMQVEQPSIELKILVNYVQKVYAPAVFAIVKNPGIENGSHIFLSVLMNSIACLSEEHWNSISDDFARKFFS